VVDLSKLRNLVILAIFFSFIFLLQTQNVYAWLSGFAYKKAINITNSGSTALTDYQVLITLDTQTLISAGKMRSDCRDIRFTNSTDYLLSYWIESGCNTTSTKIWVKVPFIPASSTTTIYVYYGNPSATSLSNATATFIYYDDGNYFSSWTQGTYACSQDTSTGNPAPSYKCAGSIGTYMYKNIGLAPGMVITFNIMNPNNQVGDFFFLTNSSGAGQMYRLDTRGTSVSPTGYSGFATTNSWTSWSAPSSGFVATNAAWYKFTITIVNSTSATLYYSQTTDASPSNFGTLLGTYSISNKGGYIGLVGDGGGSSTYTYYDNIIVRKYTSPEPTYSIGAEEMPNQPPAITIFSPLNQTYFYSNNFVFNFSVSDDKSSTFWIRAYLDNNLVYENTSYINNAIVVLTQNLTQVKSYNFTVWANDTDVDLPKASNSTIIFTIKDFEIQQISFNTNVYETTQQTFSEIIRYNPDLVQNISSILVWNSTNYQTIQTQNSTHFTLTSNIYIPLVKTNNTAVNFYFTNTIYYLNGTTATINSQTNQQNILLAYSPRVNFINVILYNNTLYSNSTIFNFSYGNLTPFVNPDLRFRVYANGSLVKDDTNLTFTFTPNTDSIYYHNFSIAFLGSEKFFNYTTIYYIYTIIFYHSLNITFGFFTTTPQQTFNFSAYSPLAPYVNCSLLNLYNATYNRTNYNTWYSYIFPVNQSPITLSFVCRDFFNTNSSIYQYPVYIIKILPVDEEVGVYNTSLWLDPTTNKTAIIRFVAISPNFNQSIISERINQTMWLIVPTNTWIMTVQTLYSLQYFTQTYVLRDWVKYELPVCIPENKPQNLQTAYTSTPLDWSFIVRRGDTGCVKVIDKDTNSLGNYFGFYFYTLPGLYTLSKLENGTEIFISALRGESENLVDLQKIIYQWKQALQKIATTARISIMNVLGGENSTIVYVTTNVVDNYKLEIYKDNNLIYTQAFPSTSNFTLTLMWRSVGINPDDKLTFKLFGSSGLVYQITATATGKIYKYSSIFTGIILVVILLFTFLKPINIEKIFILSLFALFLAFYLIPQTEPSIYLNMLGFAIIVLVVSSGVIVWKTIK
jgi:hypothetical protein